jgi:hypothetical protein
MACLTHLAMLLCTPLLAAMAAGVSASDPYYADPLFDAAHDAEFVWHEGEQAWWVIYLQVKQIFYGSAPPFMQHTRTHAHHTHCALHSCFCMVRLFGKRAVAHSTHAPMPLPFESPLCWPCWQLRPTSFACEEDIHI